MWRNGRRKRLKIARETMWVRVPPPASEAAWNRTISGCFSFFQKTLHRNRLGTLYCHEGDWSWIYFFNGQCADAAGTALWQWLGQQRR